MSTPPRDYSTDYASPSPGSEQSDVVPAPPSLPATSERDGWRDSIERTDEIELLISAAVFFGLLQVPGWMMAFWENWSVHQPEAAFNVGSTLMQVGYGVVFVLLASFFFHLILRAFWIGLIGLRAVFPRGIDWQRLERAAPITTAYQRANTPELTTTIVSVDRVASIVFACASLLVMMTLPGVVFALLGLFLNSQRLAWVTVAFLIAISVPLLLQLILDYGIAARSPKWAAKPWLRRTATSIVTITSRFMPRGLVLAPMLTLQSRVSQLWFTLGMMLAISIALLAFPLHLLVQHMAANSAAYAQMDDAITRHGLTQPAGVSDRATRAGDARLDRVQARGPWIELFVPLRPRRDEAPLRARCPVFARPVPAAGIDASRAVELRDCIAGLWRITLDDAPLPPSTFELARKGNERGLLALLPTSTLAPGRHQIVATRLPIAVVGEESRDPPPPRSLLFWVAH